MWFVFSSDNYVFCLNKIDVNVKILHVTVTPCVFKNFVFPHLIFYRLRLTVRTMFCCGSVCKLPTCKKKTLRIDHFHRRFSILSVSEIENFARPTGRRSIIRVLNVLTHEKCPIKPTKQSAALTGPIESAPAVIIYSFDCALFI
jgi:hypothetical protein